MFDKIKEFFKKWTAKFLDFINLSKTFIKQQKEKLKNLYQTNYNTGMFHLEHGNLWDAAFRFKIIKKFWPDKLEAQYQYAICLVLEDMKNDAIALLKDILKKDENYSDAKQLLNDLENNIENPVIKSYKEKFKKSETNTENK